MRAPTDKRGRKLAAQHKPPTFDRREVSAADVVSYRRVSLSAAQRWLARVERRHPGWVKTKEGVAKKPSRYMLWEDYVRAEAEEAAGATLLAEFRRLAARASDAEATLRVLAAEAAETRRRLLAVEGRAASLERRQREGYHPVD